MSIYDRDYMKAKQGSVSSSAQPPRKEVSSNTWWERLRFKLWLLFHPSKW